MWFKGTMIKTRNRSLVNGRATTLAATWCCLPLLAGKGEANPSMLRKRNLFRDIKVTLFNGPTPISLLEASVLGWVRSERRYNEREWYDQAHTLTKWHLYQRLETLKFLLQNNAKPDGSFKTQVKTYVQHSQGPAPLKHIYRSLVDELFDNKSDLTSYNVRKRLLLESDELPPGDFPELKIGVRII